MENKKIGFLICSTGFGGLEMNVLRLCDWMGERDWETTIFTYEGTRVANEAQEANLKVVFIPKHRKHFDFFKGASFASLLKEEEIRYLITSDNKNLDFIFCAKSFYRDLKVIYQQQMQIGVKKKDFLHSMRFNAIDCWVSPLEWLKKEVEEKTNFPSEKIEIIPLNTDTTKFLCRIYELEETKAFWGIDPKKTTLGIMGRIDEKKGQLTAVKAVHQLIKDGQDVQLLFVGEATINSSYSLDYLKSIEDYIKEHQLEKVVFIKPFTKDVKKFYDAIDLFIMASFGETFGMVTIEALLCGLPIVGTNSGGTPEILNFGEYGALFNVDDEIDLANKISNMLLNPITFKGKAKRGQEVALSKYSHTTMCEGFEKIIEELA